MTRRKIVGVQKKNLVSHGALAPKDTRIVRAAIHPGIGIARVGNSQAYLVGPQVIDPDPLPTGSYRDEQGALKRQAAEFRVYGYNAAGEAVCEINADNGLLGWSVHLANKKAAWYQWRLAMDIPEAATVAMPLRNADVQAVDARKGLVIDAGLQSVVGKTQARELVGAFQATRVLLGEMRTDTCGRLHLVAGFGFSSSPVGIPIFDRNDEDSFGNAIGWHDDVADGPVTAQVRIDGQDIEVEPAWVVSAPPNYAPAIKGVRTMYDLLMDLYIDAKWLAAPAKPSFRYDIYPILQRLSGLQWVNQGFAAQFGHRSTYDFENPVYAKALSYLGRNTVADQEVRRRIARSFRVADGGDGNQLPWPWLYGDAMEIPAGSSPRQNTTISRNQLQVLEHWVTGNYSDDWGQPDQHITSVDQLPVAQQPAMLDRSALEFCVADAFHPGIELPWAMRHLSIYDKPFRVRHRSKGLEPAQLGLTLTQHAALGPEGPLHEQGPGDLTRWMALPWQADTAGCRSGYDRKYDPFLPSFWPARVPNQVLSTKAYEDLQVPGLPPEKAWDIFSNRISWFAPVDVGASFGDYMMNMVKIFGSMGVLESRTVIGIGLLPSRVMVASYASPVGPDGKLATTIKSTAGEYARAENFASDEEAAQAPLPVRPPSARQRTP
jgi:hypothetical protein